MWSDSDSRIFTAQTSLISATQLIKRLDGGGGVLKLQKDTYTGEITGEFSRRDPAAVKASRRLIAPAIISAFVHMVSLPGKSHYPAAPLFFCCFLLVECDFRARASAPFNASNTIKDSSLNDVGLDGHASGCPGARERPFCLAAAEAPCQFHSGRSRRRQEIKIRFND